MIVDSHSLSGSGSTFLGLQTSSCARKNVLVSCGFVVGVRPEQGELVSVCETGALSTDPRRERL